MLRHIPCDPDLEVATFDPSTGQYACCGHQNTFCSGCASLASNGALAMKLDVKAVNTSFFTVGFRVYWLQGLGAAKWPVSHHRHEYCLVGQVGQ